MNKKDMKTVGIIAAVSLFVALGVSYFGADEKVKEIRDSREVK